MGDVAGFVFPEPWRDLRGHDRQDVEEREELARRLRVETAEGHPLFGASVTVVARCQACDEVFYDLGDSRYALVHLTWSFSLPEPPPWPSTTVCHSWAEAEQAVVEHDPSWD